MRDFQWGYRIAHIIGDIIQALIILISVAVLAGLIFLLVRYLLVATRAAQLYVAQHERPPTVTPEVHPTAGESPAGATPEPPEPTAPTKPFDAEAPTEPVRPGRRPTKPKSPPSA